LTRGVTHTNINGDGYRWNNAMLEAMLAELREERHHSDTARLIAEAEQIKNSTNYIHEENATQ